MTNRFLWFGLTDDCIYVSLVLILCVFVMCTARPSLRAAVAEVDDVCMEADCTVKESRVACRSESLNNDNLNEVEVPLSSVFSGN